MSSDQSLASLKCCTNRREYDGGFAGRYDGAGAVESLLHCSTRVVRFRFFLLLLSVSSIRMPARRSLRGSRRRLRGIERIECERSSLANSRREGLRVGGDLPMATTKMVTAIRTPWLAALDSGSENCCRRIWVKTEATVALGLVSQWAESGLRCTD